jgi:hypothetical protein
MTPLIISSRRRAALSLLAAATCALSFPAGAVGRAQTAAAPAAQRADQHAPSPAHAPMVQFDALYIPALAATSAAQSDPRVAAKARAATARLHAAWPALQRAMASHAPDAVHAAAWQAALRQVSRRLQRGDQAVAAGRWKDAHEALEGVRVDLMTVRQAAGFDYFVDRLTIYHEPMERLALAGLNGTPSALGAAQRAVLERDFAAARAQWHDIERHLPDPVAYRLGTARHTHFRQGVLAEGVALQRLSDALRSPDNAAVQAAAKGLKPPFARVFTAFGLAEGENPSD